MRKHFLNSVLTLFFAALMVSGLTACVSSGKRRQALESAIGDKAKLEDLCSTGEAGACALAGKPALPQKPLPVMQSETSANQTRIVVQVPKSQTMTYFMRSGGVLTRLNSERMNSSGSSWAVDHLDIFLLDPKAEYELLVIGPDSNLYDKRVFKTLDVDRRRARLAIVSGLDDRLLNEQTKMWTELAAQKPDVVVIAGDGVYADGVSSSQIWNRYADVRANLELFRAARLIPVFAVWNGQDLGKIGADRTFAGREKAAEVFHTFFAQKKPASGFEPGPGTSSRWTAFGANFFFLDNRSFRSPNGVDLPDQTHFGLDQEQWLATKISESKQPSFLISGDQFFGGYHAFESFEGDHPKRFKSEIEELGKIKAPVVFVSGGRSLSEVLKLTALGYTTFEITSGPIHAATSVDAFKKDPSPAQLAGAAGQLNYIMLEIMRAERGLVRFDVKSFGPGSKLFFQKTLMVKH